MPAEWLTGKTEPRLYRALPRGIGVGWTCGCICCGGNKERLYHELSCYVPSRETGEVIVKLFSRGAYLDYSPQEPNRIQIKLGACDHHLGMLEQLLLEIQATEDRRDGPGISREMVDEIIGLIGHRMIG